MFFKGSRRTFLLDVCTFLTKTICHCPTAHISLQSLPRISVHRSMPQTYIAHSATMKLFSLRISNLSSKVWKWVINMLFVEFNMEEALKVRGEEQFTLFQELTNY